MIRYSHHSFSSTKVTTPKYPMANPAHVAMSLTQKASCIYCFWALSKLQLQMEEEICSRGDTEKCFREIQMQCHRFKELRVREKEKTVWRPFFKKNKQAQKPRGKKLHRNQPRSRNSRNISKQQKLWVIKNHIVLLQTTSQIC